MVSKDTISLKINPSGAPTQVKKNFSTMCSRFSLESHDQSGETAVLRGAGPPKQDPLGEISQLQVQATAQENLHHRRQEAAHRRVQAADALTTPGDEAVFCGVSVATHRDNDSDHHGEICG